MRVCALVSLGHLRPYDLKRNNLPVAGDMFDVSFSLNYYILIKKKTGRYDPKLYFVSPCQ